MDTNELMQLSSYNDCQIALITKHAKSRAIAPSFFKYLRAFVIEYFIDTDLLGTFSGEIERIGSSLDCVKKKCELAFEQKNGNVEYALASEGSFGPHPFIPFISCDHEILYFIDRKRGFHLSESVISEKTNHCGKKVTSLDEVHEFVKRVGFPSHGVIIRPYKMDLKKFIFKGIDSWDLLEEAFRESIKYSLQEGVWIETDMRALFNPSRMKVIEDVALKMSRRLSTCCPLCCLPGFGLVKSLRGLECSCCGLETHFVKSEVFGCVKCDYEEVRGRSDGKTKADSDNCPYCNP